MTHTFVLRWRFGLVSRFVNRFLQKFTRARDKCESGVAETETKIEELTTLKTQFESQANLVNKFLSLLK